MQYQVSLYINVASAPPYQTNKMQWTHPVPRNTHSCMQLQVPHDNKVDLSAVYTAAAVIKFGTVSLSMCIKYFAR